MGLWLHRLSYSGGTFELWTSLFSLISFSLRKLSLCDYCFSVWMHKTVWLPCFISISFEFSDQSQSELLERSRPPTDQDDKDVIEIIDIKMCFKLLKIASQMRKKKPLTYLPHTVRLQWMLRPNYPLEKQVFNRICSKYLWIQPHDRKP